MNISRIVNVFRILYIVLNLHIIWNENKTSVQKSYKTLYVGETHPILLCNYIYILFCVYFCVFIHINPLQKANNAHKKLWNIGIPAKHFFFCSQKECFSQKEFLCIIHIYLNIFVLKLRKYY